MVRAPRAVCRATVAACVQAANLTASSARARPSQGLGFLNSGRNIENSALDGALKEAIRAAREVGRLEQVILQPCVGASGACDELGGSAIEWQDAI